ncbi:MFS transporter [Amycolatopsis jejuensis]|uniref:MFS transporter n=1 Tax=Amycolatopsis jejuensis TaxID=330084 RepID=UPI0005273D02|nr:MFS transporter [Amycolatopsis jejuensis]
MDDTSTVRNRTTGLGDPVAISRGKIAYATVVCFFAWTFSVYDYTLFGTLLPLMAADLGWSTAFSTAMNTYASIGMVLGTLAIGPMLDRLGRRNSLLATTAGAGISSALTVVAPNAGIMAVIRTFSGLGYAEEVANSVYLKELYGNRKSQGLLYSFVQSGFPVGLLVGAAISKALVPEWGWRSAFLVGLAPAVIVVLLRVWLPETPVFAAMKRARKLRAEGKEAEAGALARQHGLEIKRIGRSAYRQLLEPGIRRHALFLIAGFLCNMIGLAIFSILGTTVLTQAKHVNFDNALVLLLISNGGAIVGYILHGFLGDLIPRRIVIAGGWLVSGIAFTVMLIGPDNPGFVLTCYSIGLFFMLGPYAPLLYYISESFPAHLRGAGASVVNGMGPVGLIVGSGLLTILLQSGLTMTAAALIAGSVTTIASAGFLLGARDKLEGAPS